MVMQWGLVLVHLICWLFVMVYKLIFELINSQLYQVCNRSKTNCDDLCHDLLQLVMLFMREYTFVSVKYDNFCQISRGMWISIYLILING